MILLGRYLAVYGRFWSFLTPLEGIRPLLMSQLDFALLDETCFDVYLNDKAYWCCVPSTVWRYTIGGYQVIKTWLSYRERARVFDTPRVDHLEAFRSSESRPPHRCLYRRGADIIIPGHWHSTPTDLGPRRRCRRG